MCEIISIILTVSDSQGQLNQTERTINKSASQPFIGTSQPYNRLAWNPELQEQVKTKRDEVSF